MNQERKALMVSKETHKAIKRECVEEDQTVEELLNQQYVQKCPTCNGVNGEHKEVLHSHATPEQDERVGRCPEELSAEADLAHSNEEDETQQS